MPKIQVGDLKVHYEQAGEGFPVLLIMGLSANVDWWPEDFLAPLSRRWRTIAFDNRGAGRTQGDFSRFSIPLAAQDSLRLLDALGIEKAHVIGMSMGGMIAQELALLAPDRVERLVLACTNSGLRLGSVVSKEALRLAMRYVTSPQTRRRSRALNLLFTQEFIDANERLPAEFGKRISKAPISVAAWKKQLAAVMRFSSYRRLHQIQAPTLVISGTRDALVPHRNSILLAKRIPDARLVQIPDSGHGFLVDAAQPAASAIASFLAEHYEPEQARAAS